MPFFPTAPVRIQPYFGWRTHDRLVITARALRARADSFERGGRWRAFRTMLAQFASHEVAGRAVELEIAAPGGPPRRHAGTTDGEGFVRFDIAFDEPWDLAPHTVWESVRFHWRNRHGPQSIEGHVIAPGSAAGLAVVSDIDDTIIETGITGDFRAVLRNWRRILLEMPEERLLVPGADVFYSALGGSLADADEARPAPPAGERRPAPHRPFFYVSSSPWNLFSYLVAYIGRRGLPLGPILLRDWGFDRDTLGSGSHGDHKRAAIAAIMAQYPQLQFALIGDDTQGDLPAFAALVAAHPGRVRAVFVRTTAGAFSPEEEAGRAAIEAAGVPLWLGAAFDKGHEFLAALGLSGDGEAGQVIAAVADTDRPAIAAQ